VAQKKPPKTIENIECEYYKQFSSTQETIARNKVLCALYPWWLRQVATDFNSSKKISGCIEIKTSWCQDNEYELC